MSQGGEQNQLSDAARRQLQIRLRLQGINNDIAQGSSVQDALGSVKAAATGAGQGALAFVDGAIDIVPVVNAKPFESLGLYDPNDNGLKTSQLIGSVTRDAALFISGGASVAAARASGAQITLGRRLIATEFGPSITTVLSTGPITTTKIATDYVLKIAGRVATVQDFRDLNPE